MMFPRSLIYFLWFVCAAGACAQENSALDVPTVVVSATRSQQSLLTVPGSIAVISR